jgi:hypothetical protein
VISLTSEKKGRAVMKNGNMFQSAMVLGFTLVFAVTLSAAPRRLTLKSKTPPAATAPAAMLAPKLVHINPSVRLKQKKAPAFHLKNDKNVKLTKAPTALSMAKKASLVENKHKFEMPVMLTVSRPNVNNSFLVFRDMYMVTGGSIGQENSIEGAKTFSNGCSNQASSTVELSFLPQKTGVFLIDFLVTATIMDSPYSVYFFKNSSYYNIPATLDGHVTFTVQANKGERMRISFGTPQLANWQFHGCEITPLN